MSDSIFTKIIKGEIPCYKIAEDDRFIAFLDVFPIKKGHTLVVPKVQIDYLFDLDDSLLSDLMIFAKKVSQKMQSAISCERIGIAVIGLEVPHAHIHLVPLDTVGDIDFSQPKLQLSAMEMTEIADSIRIN
ncbi:MAG: HIT domain-containing protein [Bacteroidota bacterium]|nr:HIT domain-containing protein [Bacteroidota bacterium]MEC7814137.1 HIT domain-containing protein [Bacteroidota bacterium]